MRTRLLEGIAVIGIRLLAASLLAAALFLWIHAALSDSFAMRQLPEELAASGIELRLGEASAQTAALLGAAGIFTFVLSRGLARWLVAGLH